MATFNKSPGLTTLKLFQAAHSRGALASLLSIDLKTLTYLLYVLNDAEKYSTFRIPKKGGGYREISAPIREISSLQRKLADNLELCLDELASQSGWANSASHGYRLGKSILTNASVHRNKRFVFNLDLKNFFPTITGRRIRGFLINDSNFRFHADVATTIAHIACLDGKLPQGSPCSPVLSNLIAGILDFHLARLAKANGCHYTRYADDLTFSTNKKEFPKPIAINETEEPHNWKIGKQLRGLITKSGFVINEKKTRMQYRTSRQQVTGLVVNKKVNVTSEYKKLVRAYVFSLITQGRFTIQRNVINKEGKVELEIVEGSRAQLHGMLGFIHSVQNVYEADVRSHSYNYPDQQRSPNRPSGNLATYRRFLLYTIFYDNDLPLILCEGKTDGVYISNAVHQSKKEFPRLVRKNDENKDILSFRLLKYARRHKKKKNVYLPNFSTVSILGGGSGGGGNLGKLIRAYHNEIRKFKGPMGKSPVIFIVDNDKGGKSVYNIAKDLLKKSITGHEPFVHVFANMYIVPVPLEGKKKRSIEDLFSKHDLAKGLNGKPFDFSDEADRKTTVGKAEFAYEFVAKQAENLDWEGFQSLLRNICAAMDDYDNRHAKSKT